jgi:arsenite methyltransferase
MTIDEHATPRSDGDTSEVLPDVSALRAAVREKYRRVAADPGGSYHFHTGRALASLLGYDATIVDALPERAVESFAGVANPFSLRPLELGEHVVDVGSGAGFDSFVAASLVGDQGRVVGVDMTPAMLAKSQVVAHSLALTHVEFREGFAEALPVDDGWADVVISNGVINLCADKRKVFEEIRRVLKPGGWLQFADIATGRPVPPEALRDIDLWSG